MTCIVLLYQISTKLSGPQYELYQGPLKLIDIYKLSLNHLARRHRCKCTLFRPGIVSHRHQRTRCCKLIGTQHLFNEIYLRDITKRNRVKNIGELEDLLNILSSAIGSLTNPEKLKNTFKTVKKSRITSATIKKYLDYFEDSFLIESAQRYDIKGKAYIETPRKYYFSDLGLRNARINFRQFEQTHSMENVIYNELRMRGYSVDVGVIPIAERDQEGKVIRKQLEVDFVCNLGSSRYYIQSAYSLPDEAKRTQEIRPFRKIDDSFKKIVVTKDIVQPHYDEYGIFTVNIYDFLLDPQILEK